MKGAHPAGTMTVLCKYQPIRVSYLWFDFLKRNQKIWSDGSENFHWRKMRQPPVKLGLWVDFSQFISGSPGSIMGNCRFFFDTWHLTQPMRLFLPFKQLGHRKSHQSQTKHNSTSTETTRWTALQLWGRISMLLCPWANSLQLCWSVTNPTLWS